MAFSFCLLKYDGPSIRSSDSLRWNLGLPSCRSVLTTTISRVLYSFEPCFGISKEDSIASSSRRSVGKGTGSVALVDFSDEDGDDFGILKFADSRVGGLTINRIRRGADSAELLVGAMAVRMW